MKKLLLFVMAISMGLTTINAQEVEAGPFSEGPVNTADALFDLLWQIDIGATGTVGVNGLAGVIWFGGEFWISEWQTDVIHVLDQNGTFVESFAIPGVTGTRAMTTDGTNIYIGTAGLQMFEIDPGTRMVTNTINITTASDAEARMITYDETLDGGNGGFWIGDFGSDIASVDMSGNELSVIPAATHNTVIYGGAIDNISPGGPFLWISDQSGTAPSRHFITQLDPSTGNQTGVVYDYTADGGAIGATEVLAGGLFISENDLNPGFAVLLGLCQCTPSNTIFQLELVELAGVDDNAIANLNISPNPANDIVTISTQTPGEKQVVVFDVLGQQVLRATINDELNVSNLNSGVYMIQVTQNGSTATKKLIKR